MSGIGEICKLDYILRAAVSDLGVDGFGIGVIKSLDREGCREGRLVEERR